MTIGAHAPCPRCGLLDWGCTSTACTSEESTETRLHWYAMAPPTPESVEAMEATMRRVREAIGPPLPGYLYCTPWAWQDMRSRLVEEHGYAYRRLALTAEGETIGYVTLPGAIEVILTTSMKLPRCGWAMLHERDAEMDAERVDATERKEPDSPEGEPGS